MEFNREKCHVLTLGKFENTKYTHRYHLGGDEIEHVFSEKDLGITIDSELTYDDHISNKIRVANGIVGLMGEVSLTWILQHSKNSSVLLSGLT
jgi:hypothetical protein